MSTYLAVHFVEEGHVGDPAGTAGGGSPLQKHSVRCVDAQVAVALVVPLRASVQQRLKESLLLLFLRT